MPTFKEEDFKMIDCIETPKEQEMEAQEALYLGHPLAEMSDIRFVQFFNGRLASTFTPQSWLFAAGRQAKRRGLKWNRERGKLEIPPIVQD